MKDEKEALSGIAAAFAAGGSAAEISKRIAESIRISGGYRWVGICEVKEPDVTMIGWTGAETPAFLNFSTTRGITRDVIKAGAPVVVADVRKDSRYLVANSTTRSEMIVPILGMSGAIVGTIEVDSDRENAFSEEDVRFVERCAAASERLFAK